MKQRPPFVFWCSLWGVGSAISIVSMSVDIRGGQMQTVLGRDFMNLWVAAKLALTDQTWAIFNVDAFRIALHEYLGVVSMQNYSYPPHALFIAAPFGLFPYLIALALWTALGVWFFIRCAKPYLPEGFAPALAALTPAATLNIWNGHYGFLLGGLWLICFRNIERNPTRSGVTAGILTFKPHMGLFIAALVATRRKALITAVLTALALVILSEGVFGGWFEFLTQTTAEQGQILSRTSDEFYFRMMPSAYIALGKGIPGVVAQLGSAIGAIALLAKARKLDAFTAATATFLVVPYVFNYDMTVACLGFAIPLYDRWSSMTWTERSAFVLAFLSPELTYFASYVVAPVLLGVLYFQVRYVCAVTRPTELETLDAPQNALDTQHRSVVA